MEKFLLLIFFYIFIVLPAIATEQDALDFFDKYVNLSNQWSLEVINMYTQNPIIKRNVLKKPPILIVVPFDKHKKMLINYNKHKNLLKGIQNNYEKRCAINLGNNKYKISAQRCPTIMNRCFDSYMIIQKQDNQFKILEEYSDVKTTYFLKFKDNK